MKSTKALTRKDIKKFLATFAEAILVDQKRVNKLPRKELHPEYDHGMWKRNREDHVAAIVKLSVTVQRSVSFAHSAGICRYEEKLDRTRTIRVC